jgi:hypothetical protein
LPGSSGCWAMRTNEIGPVKDTPPPIYSRSDSWRKISDKFRFDWFLPTIGRCIYMSVQLSNGVHVDKDCFWRETRGETIRVRWDLVFHRFLPSIERFEISTMSDGRNPRTDETRETLFPLLLGIDLCVWTVYREMGQLYSETTGTFETHRFNGYSGNI